MENWSASDISDFFWKLGPAAVGLFLIWFGQSKVAPTRDQEGPIKRVGYFAYGACWMSGISMLTLFVWIWVKPYLGDGYYAGALINVSNKFTVATIDEDTARIFYLSERTRLSNSGQPVPIRTFSFVVRDAQGTALNRPLQLSFSSRDSDYYANVDLKKLDHASLLREIVLEFLEDAKPSGEKSYLLRHVASKAEFPLRKSSDQAAAGPAMSATKFAANDQLPIGWLGGLMSAFAQSAPSLDWTTESLVTGLESGAVRVRAVAVSELGDKLLKRQDYASTAEAIVTRKLDGSTLRGRWSVYDAVKAAVLRARETPRNGILEPAVPPTIPLSSSALEQVLVDAVSGVASANDAAKWLFRFDADRRLIDVLFRQLESEPSPEKKACYSAFAANVFYNWAVYAFLSAKDDKHDWKITQGDVALVERFYARVSGLSTVVEAKPTWASQYLIADYGLGLFYAGLYTLPANRLSGPFEAPRDGWARRSKELMSGFAQRLAPGTPAFEAYRYPFHRDVALAVVAGDSIKPDALEPVSPKVNPKVSDITCLKPPE